MNKAYRGQFWKISLLKWRLWKVNPLTFSLKMKECSHLLKWILAPRGLLDSKLPKFFFLKYIKTHTQQWWWYYQMCYPPYLAHQTFGHAQPLNNTIHCDNSTFNSAPAYALAERVPGLTLTQWTRLKKYKMDTSKEQWQQLLLTMEQCGELKCLRRLILFQPQCWGWDACNVSWAIGDIETIFLYLERQLHCSNATFLEPIFMTDFFQSTNCVKLQKC